MGKRIVDDIIRELADTRVARVRRDEDGAAYERAPVEPLPVYATRWPNVFALLSVRFTSLS